jgi:hypothetical protein
MKIWFPHLVKITQRARNSRLPHTQDFSLPHCCCSSVPLLVTTTQWRHRPYSPLCKPPLTDEIDLAPRRCTLLARLHRSTHQRSNCCCHRHCPLCSPLPDSKAKCNNALYFHGRPFSPKLISLLKFIDAIPRQGSLVSSAGGVMALLDEGGP